MKSYKTIDEYLKALPKDLQPKVREMRTLANKLVPKGEEAIRYGMPTIRVNDENLIHFAGMKGHLGFYPAPSGVKAFEDALVKAGLSYSKGCIRFSYDKPLPIPLITKIIKFRLKEVK
jgi:uncharacterized protein YdhG (YjbR/CyaY superfamily)